MICPNCNEEVARATRFGTTKDGRYYGMNADGSFVHWCKPDKQPGDYRKAMAKVGKTGGTRRIEENERLADQLLVDAGFDDSNEAPADLVIAAREAASGNTSSLRLFLQQVAKLKPAPRTSREVNEKPRTVLKLSDAAVEQVLMAQGRAPLSIEEMVAEIEGEGYTVMESEDEPAQNE